MPRKYPESFPIELRDWVTFLSAPQTAVRERLIPTPSLKDASALQSEFNAYIGALRKTADANKEEQTKYTELREAARTVRTFYKMIPTDTGLRIVPKSDGRAGRLLGPALQAAQAEEGFRQAEDRAVGALPGAPTPAPEAPPADPDLDSGSLYGSLLPPAKLPKEPS